METRLATAADIPALNAVAWAAKAHWGYTTQQLEAWRDDLEVGPDTLDVRPVFLVEDEHGLAGFVQLATDTSPWEIWAMWVHPQRMSQGIGRGLMAQACAFAKAAGATEIAIDADPNAEGFYRACGATVVGLIHAPIEGQPDRTRPQLLLRVG